MADNYSSSSTRSFSLSSPLPSSSSSSGANISTSSTTSVTGTPNLSSNYSSKTMYSSSASKPLTVGQEFTSNLLSKYDRPSSAGGANNNNNPSSLITTGTLSSSSDIVTPSSITQRMHETRDVSSEYGSSASVIQQLKTNLINNSAELLIAKGRIEELSRERERFAAQLADAQGELQLSKRDSRIQASLQEEINTLRGTTSKLERELRTSNERASTVQQESERERQNVTSLRAQIAQLQRESQDAQAAASQRLRDMEKDNRTLTGQVATNREEITALGRERDNLLSRIDQTQRASREFENMLDDSRRENEELRSRLKEYARESDNAQTQVTTTMATLQKTRSELQAQINSQQSTVSALNAKVEALQTAKSRAEAEATRAQTAAEAAREEISRITARWRAVEERASELDAQVLSYKTKLHDANTQVQIAQSAVQAARVAAQSPVAARDEEIANLKRQLRELEAERETITDILASIVPLPHFVRDRAAESGREDTTSASSTSSTTTSGSTETSSAESSGRLSTRYGNAMDDASSLSGQLRSIAIERPMVINAMTYMDMQLRALRTDKERLVAALEASKAAEQNAETSLAQLRRQLNAARAETAQLTDSRDETANRLNRCEAEVRNRIAELAQVREQLAIESAKREGLGKQLDDTRSALALVQDELSASQNRLENYRAESEQTINLERTMKEQLQRAHQQQMSDTTAEFQRQIDSLVSRNGTLEGQLDTARHDASTLSHKLSLMQSDVDRSRADAASLSSKLMQTELAVKQAEAAHTEAVNAARDAETARARTADALEEAIAERDATSSRLAALSGEVEVMKAHMNELEARERIHAETVEKLHSVQNMVADLETVVAAKQAEIEACNARMELLREQTKVDLDNAHRTSTQLGDELRDMMLRREEDAASAAQQAAASARSIAQLKTELEAQSNEAATLRDRCRRLQTESQQLANEVQEARDQARTWNDDAMRARSELQSEMDRSANTIRTLMDQVEAVKADFYAFLALFHPAEAAAAIVASTTAASSVNNGTRTLPRSTGITIPSSLANLSTTTSYGTASANMASLVSPVKLSPTSLMNTTLNNVAAATSRSPASSTTTATDSLVNRLATDMTDLKRRLEAFTSTSKDTTPLASSSATSSSGTNTYRGTTAGTAYMSRALQSDMRTSYNRPGSY